jgi:hypothetical protein
VDIVAAIASLLPASAAVADGCPKFSDNIATDRPDITNSSTVVPVGSLQSENGSPRPWGLDCRRAPSITGPGVQNACTEHLAAFSKPPVFEESVHVDVGKQWARDATLRRAACIALAATHAPFPVTVPFLDRRFQPQLDQPQPYLQLPWSRELAYNWSLRGMATLFFRPRDPISQLTTEPTFLIEKKVSERADVFLKYVGDFPGHAGPRHLLNLGGAYRLTPTQQIDFRVGLGLNRNAPNWVFGLGYSIWRDGLF